MRFLNDDRGHGAHRASTDPYVPWPGSPAGPQDAPIPQDAPPPPRAPVPEPRAVGARGPDGRKKAAGTAMAALGAVVVLAGMAGMNPPGPMAGGPGRGHGWAESAAAQGWDKPAEATTCKDWSTVMTSAQRSAMAENVLESARHSDGVGGEPPDALVTTFASALSASCAVGGGGGVNVSQTAAELYQTQRPRFAS